MYKILLPVASPAFLVKNKLIELKGHEENLIIINNWTDPETEIYVKEFAARGAEAYNCTYNLGLAASWNWGMQRMKEDNYDFVIFLSASAVFERDLRFFIDAIIKSEAKQKMARYVCSPRASLHCFCHTRLGLELGGYFDENFWPIYYEDTDYCHRSKFNSVGVPHDPISIRTMINHEGGGLVSMLGLNDIVYSHSFSATCNSKQELMSLHQTNCHRWSTYYQKKWGGDHGSEKYSHPFNDPNKDVNFWEIKEFFNHPKFKDWNPPKPSIRY
jgi:hypothetical protein